MPSALSKQEIQSIGIYMTVSLCVAGTATANHLLKTKPYKEMNICICTMYNILFE